MIRASTSILLFMLLANQTSAQCGGGLGENLFGNGDFGSGVSNIVLSDPAIAPGYIYTTQVPPDDGQYVITKDMTLWTNLWPTWLAVTENSDDPDGYMMVVNASFDSGLFYEETVDGLCDDTEYEFSADIINLIKNGTAEHIDPNIHFLINGEVVLATGDIPKNEMWNTYRFSFSTKSDEFSVNLSLRNNAPGGIGNDLALDNITFRACGPAAEATSAQVIDNFVCPGEFPIIIDALLDGLTDPTNTYRWEISQNPEEDWIEIDNQNQSSLAMETLPVGSTFIRFATASSSANLENRKCNFYSTPLEINVPETMFEATDTICGGSVLSLDDAQISEPGVYMLDLVSRDGCDSMVTLTLDTIPREIISAELELINPLCFGQASGQIIGSNISGGHPPYRLQVGSQSYNDTIAQNLSAGAYALLILDRYRCFQPAMALLEDPDSFYIDLGEDITSFLGDEITVEATSNRSIDSIIWNIDNETINQETRISFVPRRDITLQANARTEDGCVATDQVNIIVDDAINIYIPNAFSPDGNQLNDEFQVSSAGAIIERVISFSVYDRWGGELWAYSGDSPRWDGTDPRGREVPTGSYVYTMMAEIINGEIYQKTGTILLVR